MNNIEFENMVLGTNRKEESIMEQPVWDVRCWLEGLNQGEYLKVTKDGREYADADELFREIVTYGEYERSFEDGNILTIVYKNGNTIILKGQVVEVAE